MKLYGNMASSTVTTDRTHLLKRFDRFSGGIYKVNLDGTNCGMFYSLIQPFVVCVTPKAESVRSARLLPDESGLVRNLFTDFRFTWLQISVDRTIAALTS